MRQISNHILSALVLINECTQFYLHLLPSPTDRGLFGNHGAAGGRRVETRFFYYPDPSFYTSKVGKRVGIIKKALKPTQLKGMIFLVAGAGFEPTTFGL